LGLLGLGKGASPVGLDIGSSTFRVAQLKASAEKPTLITCSSARTPKGLISEGEIIDVEGVAEALASLWRAGKISEKRVVVGVANQKVIVRVIEMPAMSETELRSAIQYQVSDYIPIPIEEAILDFQILGEHENEQQEKMMDVLLVAARKDMIENTVAAVERAGLKPVVIDVSSLAFARAVMSNEPQPLVSDEDEVMGAMAMVNISSTLSDIVVVEDGIPKFTRISSIGGNTFTEVLAEQLGISFDEAEELKVKVGLALQNGDGEPDSAPPEVREYAEAVHNVLEQEMIKFIAEIRRSLDYYLVQTTRAKSIDKIIFTGGGAKLKNFINYMKESLQIEVEFGHPFRHVQISKNLLMAGVEDEELSLAICLGLALRGMDR